MVFGDTEERLSQFGDEWQILNAIREHYLMKREADHGSQLFLGSDFLPLGLQSFTPARLLLPSGEDGGGLWRALRCCCLRTCGALHRHLRSLRTRALVALSWPGPNLLSLPRAAAASQTISALGENVAC